MRYKVNGSAEMTEKALVRARSGYSRCGASPPESVRVFLCASMCGMQLACLPA
jgi:hypothetical protein